MLSVKIFAKYKCMHIIGPSYINVFLKLKIVKYNLWGSGTKLLQPDFKYEWMHRSFLYIAGRLWSSLPPRIHESNDIKSFKSALSSLDFNLA